MWLVCWAHPYFEKKSSLMTSLRFLANYNRICTGWEHSVLNHPQNASNLIQCLVTPKCTYCCTQEHQRVQTNDLSIIGSEKCTQFHNQYNIESCDWKIDFDSNCVWNSCSMMLLCTIKCSMLIMTTVSHRNLSTRYSAN